MRSETGAINVVAGNDINLNAGVDSVQKEGATKTVKKGLLSRKITTTRDQSYDETAAASTLSGELRVELNKMGKAHACNG